MSDLWLKCEEVFEGRVGKPFQVSGHRTYTRKFRVEMANKDAGPIAVAMCDGLPSPFVPYVSANGFEFDEFARHINMSCDPIDGTEGYHWMVTCEYSTDIPANAAENFPQLGGGSDLGGGGGGSSTGGGAANNPEAELPEISWDFEVVNKALQFDRNGDPFLNSAHQPFSPAPTFPVAYAVLVYTRNELTFSREKATEYAYAVNTDVFLGSPPGTVQCMPPKVTQKTKGGLNYWRVTYRLRFSQVTLADGVTPDLWQPQILDAGLCELQLDPSKPRFQEPIPILGPGGQPITQPVCLNGAGQREVGNPPPPSYRDFVVYPEKNFADLLFYGVG